MTITATNSEFPNNVVQLLATRALQVVDPDLLVVLRPLRDSDQGQVLGIFPTLKVPDMTTIETDGSQISEPTINKYSCIMQSVVTDTDPEKCVAVHSIFANRLWQMYYRDIPLHVGLTALAVVTDNSREKFQRRGVALQRYISNEVQGSFICTSWIEFWFDTETVRIS